MTGWPGVLSLRANVMRCNSRRTAVSPRREAPSGSAEKKQADDDVPEVVSDEPRDPTSGTAITAD